MAPTRRVKPVSMHRQLLIPASKLTIDLPAPRCPQHDISLPKDMFVLLKHLEVILFHVKQSPVEYPTTMFATFQESL